MLKKLILAGVCLLALNTHAEEETALEKTTGAINDTTQKVSTFLGQTRDRRANSKYFLLASYSPFDLLIPSKYGGTIGLIRTADKTWEFEYLRGSISVPFLVKDLGAMTDERYSLIARTYFGGNSFNMSYGLTYFSFAMHLGDAMINRVTAGNYPSLNLVEIQSLGFNLGIGNRWSLNKNITLGVDWLSWSQPVVITKKESIFLDHASNEQDRDDVDSAMKLIAYFPRIAVLKLQLGILF